MTASQIPSAGGELPLSPSQTIGPFFHDVAVLTGTNGVPCTGVSAERIRIEGRVLDGAGEPVDDALVEIWQPEAAQDASVGAGFARSETVDAGRFAFDAVKPGTQPHGPVPFILVRVFGRGLLRALVTRIYFSDVDNAADAVLQAIDPARRATLIAQRDTSAHTPTYHFDLRLQGERETVFFELQHEA